MAVFVEGMACTLCGKPMHGGQDLVAFESFVPNLLDPIAAFNDGVFHVACFRAHPLADQAVARSNEVQERALDRPPRCAICERTIGDPDDYLAFGHLIADQTHPLFPYNYLQVHLSCLQDWPETPRVQKLLEDLQRSGAWEGPALTNLLAQMEKAQSGS